MKLAKSQPAEQQPRVQEQSVEMSNGAECPRAEESRLNGQANGEFPPAFGTALDVAKMIGVCEGTVRSWTDQGVIPAVRIKCGRRVLYHLKTVEESLVRLQRGGLL